MKVGFKGSTLYRNVFVMLFFIAPDAQIRFYLVSTAHVSVGK